MVNGIGLGVQAPQVVVVRENEKKKGSGALAQVGNAAITAGGACIVNGVYQLLPAAGWIAAGILLIVLTLLWIGGKKK